MVQEKAPAKRRKLAQDVVAKQEEILREKPYDVNAYNKLIEEYKASDRMAELWETYGRMLAVFPHSGEAWTRYAQDLIANGETKRVEQVFAQALPIVPYVPFWQVYLAFVQQANADSPEKGSIVSQAYEYTLNRVENDLNSGQVWMQYIEFLEGLPASSSWEKQHKMDEIRKVYRRVVSLPVNNIEQLWRGYNAFENSVARTAARKFIEERSAAYMHARSVVRELTNLVKDLPSTTLPEPRKFDAAETTQLASWRKLIAFEQTNPLNADQDTVQARVVYTFQQALMSMQYFSELWFDYSSYCLQIGSRDDAIKALSQGRAINPASFFLTARLADLQEIQDNSDGVEQAFRDLITCLQSQPEIDGLAVTVAYCELLRSVCRLKGIEQARSIAHECRKLSYCTFHIYAALAELEFQAQNVAIAAQIYQVAYTKFRDAPQFVKCYLDYLFAQNDVKNAETVFEKAAADYSPAQLRSIFELYLRQQARYGDSSTLTALESRYQELYPDATAVELYARRFRHFGADPVGEELHIKGAPTTSHELIPVPASIVELANRLPPEEDYDGPEIDMPKLIELIVEFA